MALRYLFGPVTAAFAEENLYEERCAGRCIAFNAAGDAGVRVQEGDTWEDICGRLPGGWAADLVVLYLPYTNIPGGLWSAPVPLVGLAADWNLLYHGYRHRLRRCDLVLTDTAGVEAFAREGIA